MKAAMTGAVAWLVYALSLTVVLAASSGAAAEAEFDAATGYRIARYRSPVPPEVPGGTRIVAAEVEKLVKEQQAVLVDVMPSEGAGPDPATGVWRLSKARQHIPGSIWLPDAGKGQLTPEMDAYFRSNLETLTAGDRQRAIIIYCQADCWMSWNAVRRAYGYGYRRLYWLAEGTDGWRDWDGPVEDAVPAGLKVPAPVQK